MAIRKRQIAGILILTVVMWMVCCMGMTKTLAQETTDFSNVTIQPGQDGTKINVNWTTVGSSRASVVQIACASRMENEEFPEIYAKTFLGTSEKTNFEATKGVFYYANRATVENLSAMTEYVYRVGNGKLWSKYYSYKTPATKNFSALLVSDLHISEYLDWGITMDTTKIYWSEIMTKLDNLSLKTSLMLSMGDQMSQTKDLRNFETFFAPTQMQSFALAPLTGNHDISSDNNLLKFFNFPNLTENADTHEVGDYYFSYGKALFVMLNVNVNFTESENIEHKETLKAATEAYPNHDWLVVGMHEAVYGCYVPGYSESTLEEEYTRFSSVIDAIDEYKADLVLTGHSHIYGRSHIMKKGLIAGQTSENPVVDANGTVYINLGSTSKLPQLWQGEHLPKYDWLAKENVGRPTYSTMDVKGNSLIIKTFDLLTDSPIDKLELKKSSIATDDGIGEIPLPEEIVNLPKGEVPDIVEIPSSNGIKTLFFSVMSIAVLGICGCLFVLIQNRKINAKKGEKNNDHKIK